jgi:hypothetical protein
MVGDIDAPSPKKSSRSMMPPRLMPMRKANALIVGRGGGTVGHRRLHLNRFPPHNFVDQFPVTDQ